VLLHLLRSNRPGWNRPTDQPKNTPPRRHGESPSIDIVTAETEHDPTVSWCTSILGKEQAALHQEDDTLTQQSDIPRRAIAGKGAGPVKLSGFAR
jgi:hypothetical protein